MRVPENGAWAFEALVVAKDGATGATAGWQVKGAVTRDGGAPARLAGPAGLSPLPGCPAGSLPPGVTLLAADPAALLWCVWPETVGNDLVFKVSGGPLCDLQGPRIHLPPVPPVAPPGLPTCAIRWVASIETAELLTP